MKEKVERILELVKEIEYYSNYKKKLKETLNRVREDYQKGVIGEKGYKEFLGKYLKNKSEKDWVDYYNSYIYGLLREIDELNLGIYNYFFKIKKIKKRREDVRFVLDKKIKKEFLKSIGLKREDVKKFIKEYKEVIKEKKYSVYDSKSYVRLANFFMRGFSELFIRKFPRIFSSLKNALQKAGVKILFKSYVSSIFFYSGLMFLLIVLLTGFLLNGETVELVLRILGYSVLGWLLVFGFLFLYPYSVVGNRRRDINNKLPFAIIHMSAIAGSGAPPVKVFELVLKSKEYGALDGEFRRILNYVNLFGYDLITALREVSKDTPNERFKELLNGIITTIESGGNLKKYLKNKSDDVMNEYRLERKKYNQVVSTYSDVYTGILITAPLLFIVVLTIVNNFGGGFAGLSVESIAMIGTYALIPFLNILFMFFLNMTQPEM